MQAHSTRVNYQILFGKEMRKKKHAHKTFIGMAKRIKIEISTNKTFII